MKNCPERTLTPFTLLEAKHKQDPSADIGEHMGTSTCVLRAAALAALLMLAAGCTHSSEVTASSGCCSDTQYCPTDCTSRSSTSYNGYKTCACSGCSPSYSSGGSTGSCTDTYPQEFCDQLAAMGVDIAVTGGLIVFIIFVCLCFPLIVFGIAMVRSTRRPNFSFLCTGY